MTQTSRSVYTLSRKIATAGPIRRRKKPRGQLASGLVLQNLSAPVRTLRARRTLRSLGAPAKALWLPWGSVSARERVRNSRQGVPSIADFAIPRGPRGSPMASVGRRQRKGAGEEFPSGSSQHSGLCDDACAPGAEGGVGRVGAHGGGLLPAPFALGAEEFRSSIFQKVGYTLVV